MTIYEQKPNQLVEHPSGGSWFGIIPAITTLGLDLPEGFIYLKVGEHIVRKGQEASGFGAKHIWEGKKKELRHKNCKSLEDVSIFVAGLILKGTAIYHDQEHSKANKKRITLLRTLNGTLVLEPRSGDRNLGFHYSVITWTPRPQPKGTQVGTIAVDWEKEKVTLRSP